LDVIIHREPGASPRDGVPEYFEAGALIDTGASDNCIDYRIAQSLGLRVIDQRTISTVGGPIEVNVYLGVFEIPILRFKKLMRLFAPKIDRVNYQVLIGRSVLKDYLLTFDGPADQCIFAKPTKPPHELDDDFAT
jgi:predicted aspartyl protease